MTKTQYAQYLASDHWRNLRRERIEGSPFCERCDLPRWLAIIAYDQDLHVHHKTYRSLGDEPACDLEVLCRRCHEIETFGRSGLKSPKAGSCLLCGITHWNPYCDRCDHCERMLNDGYDGLKRYLNLCPRGYGAREDGTQDPNDSRDVPAPTLLEWIGHCGPKDFEDFGTLVIAPNCGAELAAVYSDHSSAEGISVAVMLCCWLWSTYGVDQLLDAFATLSTFSSCGGHPPEVFPPGLVAVADLFNVARGEREAQNNAICVQEDGDIPF